MIGRLREFLHNMTELVFIGRTYQKILAKCWERTTDCARKKLLCPAEFENASNNVKMRLPDSCIINRRVLFHRASTRVKINSPRSRGKSHFEFQVHDAVNQNSLHPSTYISKSIKIKTERNPKTAEIQIPSRQLCGDSQRNHRPCRETKPTHTLSYKLPMNLPILEISKIQYHSMVGSFKKIQASIL